VNLDPEVFAERVAAVERHLIRVQNKLPGDRDAFVASTDASDAVILHLWLAVQIVIDMAVSACVRLHLGAPATDADAFEKLAAAGHLESGLARRLTKAAGFRNVIAHAYESIDMGRIYDAAVDGPRDLRGFFTSMKPLVGPLP
jgi:uncharacterized protein YutE (UPF0331/DUF86 family)